MRELRLSEPEAAFSKDNGWDWDKRTRLVTDLVDYLAQQDKQRLHFFACGVDAGAVRKRQSAKPFPSAVRICNHYAAHYVLKWYGESYPGIISSAHLFFDNSEPFFEDFNTLRLKQESDAFEITGNREMWQLVKSSTVLFSADDIPSMQAADLLAWGTLRQMKPPQSKFLEDIAVIAKRALPSSWTRWDDSNLDEVNVPF